MPPSAASGSSAQSGHRPKPLGLILDKEQSKTDARIKVRQVTAGGSAAESKQIQVGDELIRVDGRTVTELDVAGVTDLILDPSSRNRWSSTPERTVKPTGAISTPEKQQGNKPCGIGMTVMDDPPHIVTYLAPNGPAHRSHAIEVGDCLVAIDKELVADLEMEEVVQHVIGEEGTEVDVWLERVPKGGQSQAHHQRGEEIRGQLRRLAALHQDGLLDKRTWRTEVEKCWTGCHSVRLTRGVAYSGEHQYQSEGGRSCAAEAPAPDLDRVALSLYRPAARREFEVLLPRPSRGEPSAGGRAPSAEGGEGGEGGEGAGQGRWRAEEDRPLPQAPAGGGEGQGGRKGRELSLQTDLGPAEEVEVVAFVGEGERLGMGLARTGMRIFVTEVAAGGAAEQCGAVWRGDEVAAVEETPVLGLEVGEVCGLLTGGADRHVTLTLRRTGGKSERGAAGGPAEGCFKVVLPRPGRAGRECGCAVCGAMAGAESPESRRSSRKASAPASPDKPPPEREGGVVEAVGSVFGGILALFKSPPTTPKAATTPSGSDAAKRKEEERRRQARERRKAAEAAEKLKDALREWQGLGYLHCSDDTDSVLVDSRWRVMIDVEDEDDWRWLYSQREPGQET